MKLFRVGADQSRASLPSTPVERDGVSTGWDVGLGSVALEIFFSEPPISQMRTQFPINSCGGESGISFGEPGDLPEAKNQVLRAGREAESAEAIFTPV